jgi:hypothetical protein
MLNSIAVGCTAAVYVSWGVKVPEVPVPARRVCTGSEMTGAADEELDADAIAACGVVVEIRREPTTISTTRRSRRGGAVGEATGTGSRSRSGLWR